MDEIEDARGLTTPSGEHIAALDLRDQRGTAVLSFEPNRPPTAEVDGWPLPEEAIHRDEETGTVTTMFPTRERSDVLRGRMRNNLPIALINADVEHWIMGRARVVADTALVGFALGQAPDLAFQRLRLQVSGLGQIIGRGVVAHAPWPDQAEGDGPFRDLGVKLSTESTIEWDEPGIACEAGFGVRQAGLGDPFHLAITAAPYVMVTADRPLPWDRWLEEWVRPLLHLVALATRDAQKISWVTLGNREVHERAPDLEHWPAVQVFGHGIQQRPYSVRGNLSRTPLVTLATSPVSLPSLVARWRTVQDDHPGFIDTYLPVLHEAPMPGSARFLFLTSAVEALHSSLEGEAPQPLDEYKAQQRELIKKVKASGALSSEERRALHSQLSPTNFYSLPQRLRGLRDRLPTEFIELAHLRDLAQRVPPLRNKLAHGRALGAEDHSRLADLDSALTNLVEANLLTMLGLPLDNLVERLGEDGGRP